MLPRKKTLPKPPLMLNHKGMGCKIYALSAVLEWLYQSEQIETPPPPPRKRNNKDYEKPSLRWHFKHTFKSAVGEVSNIEDLAAAAEIHPEVAAYFTECNDESTYLAVLTQAIHQGLAPIVFFDVSETGKPAEEKGKCEHSAVVVGYNNKEFSLEITQWEKYDKIDAQKLFKSSNQLPTDQTQQKYVKISTQGKVKEGAWLSEFTFMKRNASAAVIKTRTGTSPKRSNNLRNKILILDSKTKPKIKLDLMPVTFQQPSERKHQDEAGIQKIKKP